MHEPDKEQMNPVMRYRKCIMAGTSYAKKWIRYQHLAL